MTTTVDPAIAVVYIRSDLSGHARQLDESRLRRLAIRFGYDVCEVLLVDGTRSQRLVYLEDGIRAHGAEAVFVPTVEHLDGQLGRIVAQADVIEQSGETYARWSPIVEILDDSLLQQPGP